MTKLQLQKLSNCAVPFISLQAYSDEQRVARSHPIGDQCESACEDQGKLDQLELFIHGGQYLS